MARKLRIDRQVVLAYLTGFVLCLVLATYGAAIVWLAGQ